MKMKKVEFGTDINLKEFKLNEEGSFSITRPYESSQIIYLIGNFINCISGETDLSNKILTDATACMGGDLIRFSRYFRMINGIEILDKNFTLLVQNCKQFNCHNVNLFCQNYLDIFDKLRQDIIYIDPPWTGPGYKNKESIILKLNNIDISDLVHIIKEKHLAKYIFIKAPSNVCLEKLNYDSIHTIYNKSKIASFKLICMSLVN
jgi:16S rRNA G966 N2-methylase RsmD